MRARKTKTYKRRRTTPRRRPRSQKGIYANRRTRAKTRTGLHLRNLVRQNAIASSVNLTLKRRNQWLIHSGYASHPGTSQQKILFRFLANHPGLRSSTSWATYALEKQYELLLDGTSASNAYTYFPNKDGYNPPAPLENTLMLGYEQLLGYPGWLGAPLYRSCAVIGSKITVLVEPMHDQQGLQNELIARLAPDDDKQQNIPKYKANDFIVALILCRSDSGALQTEDNAFNVEQRNPSAKIVRMKVLKDSPSRACTLTYTFSARKHFGGDVVDQEDLVLHLNDVNNRPGSAHTFECTLDDYHRMEFRVLLMSMDSRYAIPDVRVTVVNEQIVKCWDVNKLGPEVEQMREEQVLTGARKRARLEDVRHHTELG